MEESLFCGGKQKNNIGLTKSTLCHYDVNVPFCLSMQLLGLGGEHAAVLCAFLDLPEPDGSSKC
jgi:hypothetical protein